MKTKFFLGGLVLLIIGQIATAQTSQLWGTIYKTSARDSGIIFKINPDGKGYSKPDTFYSKIGLTGFSRNGAVLIGSIFQASNGKLYAINSESITYAHGHFGSIICYEPATHSYTDVHDFKLTEGAVPQGSLMQGKDGKLYGMTAWGGAHNYGVIFSIDPANNVYTDLYDLDSANGFYSKGKLTQATDGKFYGMTEHGGTHNDGVIFSFDLSDDTYIKLFDFDGINGKYPTGNLTQAANGTLYGMTANGGAHNKKTDYPGGDGIIFSINPATGAFSKLRDLDSASGVNPWSSLTLAANGKLYGVAFQGGANNNGTIFSYDIVKNTFTKLFDFDGDHGGGSSGTLIQLDKGKLYGTTSWGGANSFGALFSFDPANNQYKDLFDFGGVNGANPFGDLIEVKTNLTDFSMLK